MKYQTYIEAIPTWHDATDDSAPWKYGRIPSYMPMDYVEGTVIQLYRRIPTKENNHV